MKNRDAIFTAILLVLACFALSAIDPFTKETKVTASPSTAGNLFGYAVAIDGDTAIIGAELDPVGGSAYVFVRSGGTWVQQQKVKEVTPPPDPINGTFGNAVAISGDTIVVGDPGRDVLAGAAFVFVRSGGEWTQQQELLPSDLAVGDEFGGAVAIDGDTIVVGARMKDDPAHLGAGAAYVFVRVAGTWSQQQKLSAFDADVNDDFGASVAISGDTIAVGADGGGGSGSVYVFVNGGAGWVLQQKLLASDGTALDFFGSAAALEGDTLVVGADRAGPLSSPGPGAAYVFVRNAGVWAQQQELLAADLDDGDGFGHSVGLSSDTLVVGADLDDHGATNAGSAYVFVRSAGIWSQSQKLTASDAGEGKDFGSSVAISGDTILVGSPHIDGPVDAGAAYFFERDTTPPVITSVTASPNVLSPPNHKMLPVAITVTATDNSGVAPTCAIVSVSSNEPINGQGDGDKAPDWQITGPLTVNLRAERSGAGKGRIYTVTVACEDGSGNTSTAVVNVAVPLL